ncbi:MAG: cytochrome P450 [Candidatus Methylumidiphilus sp.]
MTAFIPPFPERPAHSLGPLDMLKQIRRDCISIWSEESYRLQFMGTRILNFAFFVANCPDVIRHVLVDNADNYQKKGSPQHKILEPLLGDGLVLSEGALWHGRRQAIAPWFSAEAVAGYAETMVKASEECAERWAAVAPGSAIEVLPQMRILAADIMCRALFGDGFGLTRATQLAEAFAAYQLAIEQMDFGAFVGLPGWNRWGGAKKAAAHIHTLIDGIVAEVSKGQYPGSMLAGFLTASSLNPQAIRNELITLFMTGYEATAVTLAWAIFLVSQCPETEQKLHAEVDAAPSAAAAMDSFQSLPYTRAIIDETLRLYPPTPLLTREAQAADTIRRRHIPAGATIFIVPWLLHRHTLYWEQPDHFIPERFLPDAAVKPRDLAYIPFSAGPKDCLGKLFGTVAACLSLAVLTRRFRLRLPAGQAIAPEGRLTLRPSDNLPMLLTRR